MYRLSIGQYNNGQSSTNNQTVINAAGTGAVVLNGSNNSGTGGVVIRLGRRERVHGGDDQQRGQCAVQRNAAGGRNVDIRRHDDGKNQADAEIDPRFGRG